MRSALILIAALCASAAFATTYKWVDANGIVHYSDRSVPGAEIIDLHGSQSLRAASSPSPTPAVANPQAAATTAATQQPPYAQLDLWKPDNDETFINRGNTVTVRLRLEPDLQPGHSIWLYLDGKRVDGLPGAGEIFTLNDVYRGTHSLNAAVADASGKPVIRSQTVTFHMQQASLLSPTRRPQTPAPAPMGPATPMAPGK